MLNIFFFILCHAYSGNEVRDCCDMNKNNKIMFPSEKAGRMSLCRMQKNIN